jgi:SPP1 family holin
MKITTGTIVRTILLLAAITNQFLAALGKPLLPINDGDNGELAAAVFTTVSGLWAWWKNNSFTTHAIIADKILQASRDGESVGIIPPGEAEGEAVEPKESVEK